MVALRPLTAAQKLLDAHAIALPPMVLVPHWIVSPLKVPSSPLVPTSAQNEVDVHETPTGSSTPGPAAVLGAQEEPLNTGIELPAPSTQNVCGPHDTDMPSAPVERP